MKGRAQAFEIGSLFLCVGLLHVIGWGLFLYYAPRVPAMAGLGALAYALGLRHAFDADHISAIDDTTRYLLQRGKRPLSAGFFFSLGHSTIVLLMTVALVYATKSVETAMPRLETYGTVLGASVSGAFLWLIGSLNLLVLVEIIRIWRRAKAGDYRPERLEELLAQRGLTRRILGDRLQNLIRHCWQMFPVGLLFGLGFDTASEIGVLALAAGVATQGSAALGAISLAFLFAAGMSLMDTADGIFMTNAYDWALSSPMRKIYYNLTTTGLSAAVALLVGTIEFLQVIVVQLGLSGGIFSWLATLNFESLGYVIVGMFAIGWTVSVLVWKVRRMDEAWESAS